ncbi:extracellular solute-binding protein [Spiroplasma culicicola]|uniref:Sn-glycerol-3-phosphate ABC transporter substrate-binding protein n=1 Tax=Spiroplasma culicicola AES-1 TaxID=1276246 RepID=W6A7D1_9MOLU|nr:extracellular solute-binding protein [Spiroplasma culicicola]AHI52897.1 hypothetical protein SCULI_v1c05560 [Spiroplasma culicicola AES-1]
MKKLLTLLAASASIVSASATVVACGNKAPTNVVFMFDASVGTSSAITKQYQILVDKYNEQNPDNPVEVEIEFAAAGAIQNAILSGEVLPDLYVTYPDNVTRYLTTAEEEVVKMDDYFDTETFEPMIDSFMDEGKIGDGQYVLPMAKSFDVTNVNLRMLKELCEIVLGTESTTGQFWQKDGFHEEYTIESSNLFIDTTVVEPDENLKTLMTNIATVNNANDLRKILLKDSNNVLLAKLIYELNDKVDRNVLRDTDKVYGIGLDDMPNKVYSQYAESIEKSRIITSAQNKEFFYNYYDDQFYINDDTGMEGIDSAFKMLQDLKDIKEPGQSLSGNIDESKQNELIYTIDPSMSGTKKYSSDFFAAGTMLMASGSTAGSFYYQSKTGVKDEVFVKMNDILTIGTPTKDGEQYIMQQGPGIAAFKSTNDEKTEVAKDFVSFMMEAQNMAEFAIYTGYMPSNAKTYSDTDYMEWLKGTKNPGSSSRDNAILLQVAELIEDKTNSHFVTIEGSPMGTGVRDKVFKNVVQNQMFNDAKAVFVNSDKKVGNKNSTDTTFWKTAQPAIHNIYTDFIATGKEKYQSDTKNKSAILNERKKSL